jgi:hypothetical protein
MSGVDRQELEHRRCFLGGPPAWAGEPKPPLGELCLDGQGRSPCLLTRVRDCYRMAETP